MARAYYCWRPDTCGCELHYQYDPAVGPNHDADPITADVYTDVNGQTRRTKRCPAHQAIADPAALKNTVHFGENVRKNRLWTQLLANPSLATATTLPDGSTGAAFKGGVSVTWSYDANRVLQVTATGVTQAQKNTLQAWCNTNLGAGTVKIT